MIWNEFIINTSPDGLDILCQRLSALGLDSYQIDDENDFLEFLENNKNYWDYVDDDLKEQKKGVCRIIFYLSPADAETPQLIKTELDIIKKELPDTDFGPLTIETAARDEASWENAWKQYFRPLEIGERLYIQPVWDNTPLPDGRLKVLTDPGMAFGTGTHASTRMCLELIERYVKPGSRTADLGCGSGILTSAALVLGAEYAVMADIDPYAAEIALKNVKMNGFENVKRLSGDILNDSEILYKLAGSRCDFIFANIVADVIIKLAPLFREISREGQLIVSGIIDMREKEVYTALERAGIKILETCRSEGWTAFYCKI